MDDLIEALKILRKYINPRMEYPTNCEHDIMRVCVNPTKVSARDTERLKTLGFDADSELGCFYSYRFGSN